MRKLVWAIALVALACVCWWGFAMWSLSSNLHAWLDERRTDGWQAEARAISSSGFPAEIRARMHDLALADPKTGVALEADTLTLSARTLWPGDITLDLPQTPLRLATPEGRADLTFDTGRANLNLAPGTQLDVENLSFTSGALRARTPEGSLFSASNAELRLTLTEIPNAYNVTLHLDQYTPGTVAREALNVPDTWPLVFSSLKARATIAFDRPWDRHALEQARPQPRQIGLHEAEAHWGDVRLQLTGALDVSPDGTPTGDIVLRAQNWQAMLDLAEQADLLPPEIRDTVQNVLSSLAAGSGRTDDLDVTLTFGRGMVRIGFLPIGPSPRLILR